LKKAQFLDSGTKVYCSAENRQAEWKFGTNILPHWHIVLTAFATVQIVW
jgi:hypothetical protein